MNGWTELECGPEIKLPYENRYHAFNDFKAKKRVLRSTGDLLDKIRSVEAAKGRDELRSFYSEIQNWPADEYITRYSLVGLEARTINTVTSYQKIKSVMTDELWYVRERLLDSVK